MKWIKSRKIFISEAKIGEVIFPKQAELVKRQWGEKFLERDEITPTDKIKQGSWKLSEEDKRAVLSVFFGANMEAVYKVFESLSEKFIEVIKNSIDINLLNDNQKNKWGSVISKFDIKSPSLDEITLLYENIFRKLSVNETLAAEVIQRDGTGKPVLGEDGKPLKIEKVAGDPIYSNNLVNINSFIADFNRCYPTSAVEPRSFSGGVVYNKNKEVLFIFRNGKWDLPKGGMDKGEEMEQTAMREVEEETGVNQLKIQKKLIKTYHIFYRRGKFRLKITQWYEMTTDFKGIPLGQLEEGIEKVAWMNELQIQEALQNSYENIKLLFEK